MKRAGRRGVGAAAVVAAGLAAILVVGGATAGASEDPDHKSPSSSGEDRGGEVQVVWNSSSGRTAGVTCPDGMMAVGGGVEGPTNIASSPVIGSPLPLPGRSQNPWIALSVPTGPGIPAPNADFDFESGEFMTPEGTASAPTGWFGQTTNTPGGTRVYAICMDG